MRGLRLPWQGVVELLVDGNNLLHALAGSADPAALRLLLARLQASVPSTVRVSIILDGHPDPGSPSRVEPRRGIAVWHAGRLTADRVLTDEVAGRPLAARGRTVVVTNDHDLRSAVQRLGARGEPVSWLVQRLGSRPLQSPGGPGPRSSPGLAPARSRPGAAPPGGSQSGAHHRAGPSSGAGSSAGSAPASPTQGARSPAGSSSAAPLPAGSSSAGSSPVPPAPPSKEEAERAPWRPGRGATRKRGNPRRPPGRRHRRQTS